MFAFKLDQAKGMFFDRLAVTSRLSKAKVRVLSKAGAYTMTAARRSIRSATKSQKNKRALLLQKLSSAPARDKAKVRAELKAFDKKQTSKPGKPPKNITGLLRDNIFFGYDPQTESCVVGPVLLNSSSGAQERLEFGGPLRVGPQTVQMQPRPYMRPAHEKVSAKLAPMFKDCLK